MLYNTSRGIKCILFPVRTVAATICYQRLFITRICMNVSTIRYGAVESDSSIESYEEIDQNLKLSN